MQSPIKAFCVAAEPPVTDERAGIRRLERMERQQEACSRLELTFPLRRMQLRGSGRPSIAKLYQQAVEEAILNDELPVSVTSLHPPIWWEKGRPLEADVEEMEMR